MRAVACAVNQVLVRSPAGDPVRVDAGLVGDVLSALTLDSLLPVTVAAGATDGRPADRHRPWHFQRGPGRAPGTVEG